MNSRNKAQSALAAQKRKARWQRGLLIAGIVLGVAAVITAIVLSGGMVGVAVAGGAAVTAGLGGTAAAAAVVSMLSTAAVVSTLIGVFGAIGVGLTAFCSRQTHKMRSSMNKPLLIVRPQVKTKTKPHEKQKVDPAIERQAVRAAFDEAEDKKSVRVVQGRLERDRWALDERAKLKKAKETPAKTSYSQITQALEENEPVGYVPFEVQEGKVWKLVEEKDLGATVDSAVVKQQMASMMEVCAVDLHQAISAVVSRKTMSGDEASANIKQTNEKLASSYQALEKFCQQHHQSIPTDLFLKKKLYDQLVEAAMPKPDSGFKP